jgi:CubicO group peptidase (beta-lactamase class C family)
MHFIKFLIFILFTSSFYADEVSIGQKDFSRLTKMLHKQVKKGNYPGFFTLIQKDGELIYSDIVGFSNIEEGVKLDKDSLFRIYSMTKPITGVALMIAVDRGLVNLSDPVSKYIPEFASTKVLSENNSDLLDLTKPITLLELATHTSGLAYSFSIKGKIKEFYEKQKNLPLLCY